MTTPHPTPKAERREINAAAGLALLTIIILGPTYLRDLATGRFSTALSAAVPEGLSKHNLDGGPFWMLTAGLVVKIAGILVIAFFAYRLVKPMLRGQVFNTKNTRFLNGMTFGIFVWFIGRFPLEGMGNNWASSQLGIDWWASQGGTSLGELALPYLFACVLQLFSAAIKRGCRLEEEVDGLV
ncbi:MULTISPECIES: hypothetical protein [Corynebacterium]|uniref:DUF2975 domain-containing protein n=1 Tax=Corynebacterium segmentosum TaxID=43990 RepID=A0ABY6TC74_9CORY|nr:MULTISPECIES: hypothetical protein [Corynebacterium]WKS65259.1 hypothetical protein NLL51_03225 [Corynebacterium accolens]VEH72222.1 Uncharacterised protein [Corynebacterium segmentosum]